MFQSAKSDLKIKKIIVMKSAKEVNIFTRLIFEWTNSKTFNANLTDFVQIKPGLQEKISTPKIKKSARLWGLAKARNMFYLTSEFSLNQ